ncbi:hypothetical protein [Cytobacillus luteolus]|nr:hypothetical protein [Cytobacillus luteolus]MBP1942465.1 hypothetical protein [Cytobacillus luteolus]
MKSLRLFILGSLIITLLSGCAFFESDCVCTDEVENPTEESER